MPLESFTYLSSLTATNPVGASDPKSQGDDHIRGIKSVLLATFPNLTGAMTSSQTELNLLDGLTGLTGTGNLVASASPTFTGTALFAALTASGTITANLFSGSGASLTALNASNLSTGTVPDARFPATLPALNGSALTALNASSLASGTVPDARFPATLPALSGVNLTGITEAHITDSTILARCAANETISGTWNFSGNPPTKGVNGAFLSNFEGANNEGTVKIGTTIPTVASDVGFAGCWLMVYDA